MNTDGKGDGGSIEEILASIRRLLGDASDATGVASSESPSFSTLAEALDYDRRFEVPAMFRAPYSGNTDSSASTPGYEARDGVRREGPSAFPEPSAEANPLVAKSPPVPPSEPWFDTLSAAARTLEPMPPPPAPPLPLDTEISVPRTMVRCTDTLIGRMGQPRRQPELSPTSKPAPETPQRLAASPSKDAPTPKRLEDAAAAALRPLLREWFDNNMRLILEKALQDELSSTTQKTKS